MNAQVKSSLAIEMAPDPKPLLVAKPTPVKIASVAGKRQDCCR